MADLNLTPNWDSGVYRIETSDPVIGGENGISNKGIKNVGNRTEWLKKRMEQSGASGSNMRQSIIYGATSVSVFSPGGQSFLDNSVITGPNANRKAVITATPDTPLILSISGGNNADGPINHYVYIDDVIEVPFSDNYTFDKLVIADIDETTGIFSIILETNSTLPIVGYYPQSTTDGVYWYDLGKEQMFKRQGGAWVPCSRLILARLVPGDDQIIYFPWYGLGMRELYGFNSVPAGTVSLYAGSGNVPGYLLCNGNAINRTQYRILFSVIGTTYGSGDGSTTFNLPDIDDTAEGLKHLIKVQ